MIGYFRHYLHQRKMKFYRKEYLKRLGSKGLIANFRRLGTTRRMVYKYFGFDIYQSKTLKVLEQANKDFDKRFGVNFKKAKRGK